LHERLGRLDPSAAQNILPTNGRRIVRALEVVEVTDAPFTARLPTHEPKQHTAATMIGIAIERPDLYERIARRVDRMWAEGFVDEVRALERRGLREGVTASRALGYRQVLEVLDGTRGFEDARAETVRATKEFARRQVTWFRADPRVSWLPYDAPDRLDLARAIVDVAA
jgi:tRNA dimethylallyltransferase